MAAAPDMACSGSRELQCGGAVSRPESPRPESPQPEDCCGSGCVPCVWDRHRHALEQWRHRREEGAAADEECAGANLHPLRFTSCLLRTVRPLTPDTALYDFDLPGSDASLAGAGLQVGQHLVARTADGTCRPLTPVSAPGTRGRFQVLLKRYPLGRLSRAAAAWQPGVTRLDWCGPVARGAWRYCANRWRRLHLVCAGTGVAPMLQVLTAVLAEPEDDTVLRLACCWRRYADILMRDELLAAAAHWNVRLRHYLSAEPADSPVVAWPHPQEELRLARLDAVALADELAGFDAASDLALVCGPTAFEEDVRRFAYGLRLPDHCVHVF